MKWDCVERELLIVGTQLGALGKSFRVLASELAKEREHGNVRRYESGDVADLGNTKNKVGAPQGSLPGFWEE